LRYGILSDTHGNIEALEASLASLANENIDRYMCLGDTVGYGANPEECSKRIRELVAVCILGNHDAAVSDRMDYSYYYDAARHALDWCKSKVSEETLAWLRSLPYKHTEGEVDFCHGSPICPEEFEYIFTREKAGELLKDFDELNTVTFIGHSHLTRSFALGDGEAFNVKGPEFKLRPGYKYIITVGSVGQPRDYDPRSCCAVFDTETRQFKYVRSEYDIEAQKDKIVAAGLAYNFGARLLVGI
jgi:diadenosine tetraphosphatase ApaH/serine/threonine PP2A family protein phosphatase